MEFGIWNFKKMFLHLIVGVLLVIVFVTGKAGWAAPRLKDAALSLDKLREGYVEVCLDLCRIWPML